MRISDWSSDVCSSDLHRFRQIAVAITIQRDREPVRVAGFLQQFLRLGDVIIVMLDSLVAAELLGEAGAVDDARANGEQVLAEGFAIDSVRDRMADFRMFDRAGAGRAGGGENLVG